ncbi:MAG TPA: hypothetical protein VGC62_05470, partial [Pseudomonas sp.]|uniref:hypothetical protein n=1 Tax=Pseudomonas sp. TaxID=306 RepID=UPI002ED9DCAF
MSRDLARSGSKSDVRGLPVTLHEQVLRRVPRRSRDKPDSYILGRTSHRVGCLANKLAPTEI